MTDTEEYQLIKARLPHIAEALSLMWGYAEFYVYIEKLMLDTCDGKRQGLPSDVSQAIFNLRRLHEHKFPHIEHKPLDVWGASAI